MSNRHLTIILTILLVLLGGYGFMYMLSFAFPDSSAGQLFTMALFAVIVLAVPYWVIKLMTKDAHLRNPREKEMHLRDIPKDKDQLANS